MTGRLQRYRLYLDESGDHVFHDEGRLAEPGHRYLALVGCWFPQGETYLSFQRALEDMKQKHFPHSPDEPVILHRRDIIDRWGAFWRLQEKQACAAFDDDLCALIGAVDFAVCGVCIDKLAMKKSYADPFHPYHLALGILLERYCGWLNHMNRSGDLLAESRGGTEDGLLKNAYQHVWVHGSRFRKADFYHRALTSKAAKLKKKSENIAGLQLADLLARAIRDDILREYSKTVDAMGAFDARLLEVVQGKYNRQLYEGRVQGYGKIMFPK